jgi:hypothetical protein
MENCAKKADRVNLEKAAKNGGGERQNIKKEFAFRVRNSD